MRLKTILFSTLFYIPLIVSQTVTWKEANGDLTIPIDAIGISPIGKIFASGAGSVFVLDSSQLWGESNIGITLPTYYYYQATTFGFSDSIQFVAFVPPGGAFRSTNGGKFWQTAFNGLGSQRIIIKFFVKNDSVFALTSSAVYLSTDRGSSWSLAGVPADRPSIYDAVLFSDNSLVIATSKGLYKTTDKGKQWSSFGPFSGINCRAFAMSPSGSIYLATDDTLFLSSDNGLNWKNCAPLPISNITKIAFSDSTIFAIWRNSNIFYRFVGGVWITSATGLDNMPITDIASGSNGTIYVSTSKGVFRWDKESKVWQPASNGFKGAQAVTLANHFGFTYAGIKGKGVFRSGTFGSVWDSFNLLSKNARAIYVSNPNALVFDSAAIYRTTNDGVTWQISNAVPGKGAISFANSGISIFIGTQGDGVFLSTDNGVTWIPRSSGITGKDIVTLVSLGNDTLLAGATDGIYKSTNAGLSWNKTSTLTSITTLFQFSPKLLFAGTLNGGYSSTDGGNSWNVMNGLTGTIHNFSGDFILLSASSSDGLFLSSNSGTEWNKHLQNNVNNAITLLYKIIVGTDNGLFQGDFKNNFIMQYRWMSVGSLHNWFSSMGSEEEEGFVQQQQYGWQWPAIRPHQDIQVAKGLWIGTTNYLEPFTGEYLNHKVVGVGPRHHTFDEMFPISLTMTSKFEPPVVSVNGFPSTPLEKNVENDFVDITLKADRVIENEVLSSVGIVIHRNIRQFSQSYHDNYIISEYTFKNVNSKILTGVYFYFLYRWGINAEVRYVIGQNPIGWGINTMLDQRGDGFNPSSTFFSGNKDNDIRAVYAWHGKYPPFAQYDNIGGPVWNPYYDKLDTAGRLGASQFVGVATLHADKSTSDTTDDPLQPSTMSFEGSDDANMINFDPYYAPKMTSQYGIISKGRGPQRHADIVGPNGDPALGTSGGQSATIGFGPYTISPGDSIRIVLVEAAAGLSQEAATEIGRQFKANNGNVSELIAYKGQSKTKNDWVYTGRDSLFQTFRRALANYQSGYSIPQPPLPPKTFVVTQNSNSKIKLDWTVYTDNDPKLKGFDIYRSPDSYYGSYEKIYSSNSDVRSYTDSILTPGTKYYYYLVSIGNIADNNGAGMTPTGALQSNRYYTQTYDAVYGPTFVNNEKLLPTEFRLSQNYPNPFNPSTIIKYSLPTTAKVKLVVYDLLCREIATLVNEEQSAGWKEVQWNASGVSSGIYFCKLTVLKKEGGQLGSFVQVKKMMMMK